MRDWLREHPETVFEMTVLLVIYFGGAALIACFPANDKLVGWITGGAVVGAVVSAFGRNGGKTKDKAP